jgi:hypothetical protein
MTRVEAGDRVKILCASQSDDGTSLETAEVRATAYWIRAQATAEPLNRANEAVCGMAVGERRDFTVSRTSHAVEVLAIAKPARA